MEPLFYLIAAVVGLIVLLLVATAVVNFAQPVRRRPATVVAKRAHVGGGHGEMGARTDDEATFEEADGTRKEFGVSAREYGLIAEGDRGTLATRGSWFWGFERGG